MYLFQTNVKDKRNQFYSRVKK